MRNKIILGLILLLSLSFNFAMAADEDQKTGIGAIGDITNQILEKSGTGQELTKGADIQIVAFIGVFLRSFLAFLGVVFLLLTIYAGFLWMSASGNEEQVKKAQGILKKAVVGMAIIFATWLIYELIFGIFTS